MDLQLAALCILIGMGNVCAPPEPTVAEFAQYLNGAAHSEMPEAAKAAKPAR